MLILRLSLIHGIKFMRPPKGLDMIYLTFFRLGT